MGLRRAGAALGFVLPLFATSIAAEDPLPVVHLKSERPAADTLAPSSVVSFEAPAIVLASYPIREDFTQPVADAVDAPAALDALRAAAAANDLRRFQAVLARATTLVDAMPLGEARNASRRALLVYRDVEQVWTFSASDRTGAFYDDESLPGLHERLAADYPAYHAFIADYRVVDSAGRALYATAETRAFLLGQVTVAPPAPARPQTLVAQSVRSKPHVGRASARHLPVHRRAKARPTPLPIPVIVAQVAAAPPPPIVPAPVTAPVPQGEGSGRILMAIVLALTGFGILTMLMRTERAA